MVLERILLQTIKFDLQVEHPYQFLLRYAKQLKGASFFFTLSWVFGKNPVCTLLSRKTLDLERVPGKFTFKQYSPLNVQHFLKKLHVISFKFLMLGGLLSVNLIKVSTE